MTQISSRELKHYFEEICNRVFFGRESFEVVDGNKQLFQIIPLGMPSKFSKNEENTPQPSLEKRGRPKTVPLPPPIPSKKIFSLIEAAKILNVGTEHLRVQVNRGKIHGVKIGRRWRFTSDDLQKYVEEQAVEKTQQITINQAAKILGVAENFLRREAAKGRIKYVRIGRRFLFSPEEIERILREGIPIISSS